MVKENYKILKFFLKLIFSIFLGVSISFVIIQNNKDFKQLVQEKLTQSIKQSLVGCEVECQVESINLFFPKIVLDLLKVGPKSNCEKKFGQNFADKNEGLSSSKGFYNKTFGWECRKLEIGFSIIDFMLGGVIDIHINVQNLKIKSFMIKDGKHFSLTVWPSIMGLFSGTSIEVPTLLKSFSVNRGEIFIEEESDGHDLSVVFSSITKNISGNYKTKISFFDGCMSAYSKKIYDKLSGSAGLDFFYKAQSLYFNLDCKCAVNLQFLSGNKTCFITGKWQEDQGFFDFTSQDKAFTFSPVKFYFVNNNLYVDFGFEGDIGDLYDLLIAKKSDFSGKSYGKACLEFGDFGFGLTGNIKLENFKHKDIDICSLASLTFKNNKADHVGSISILRNDGLVFNGDFNYDINKNNFSCDFINESEFKLPFLSNWKILPKSSRLKIYGLNGSVINGIAGSCSFCANNKATNSRVNISGDLTFKDNVFNVNGKFDDKKYELSFVTFPDINLKKFIYNDTSGVTLLSINALEGDENKFNGFVKFQFLKFFIKNYFDYELLGDGDLKFYGMRKKDNFLLELNFQNGSVSFSNFYNFLNNFKISCKFDPYKKIIVAKNSIINLHKGFITSKKSVIKFDDSFNINYIYAPFIFNNCFINLKSDLFALLSGRMLLSKENNDCPLLKGLAIIERAHLKKNIFSEDERKKYFKGASAPTNNFLQDCACNISVVTKDPVKINTDFINTSANLDLVIKNKIFDPQLSGKIDFVAGSLAFPYKPLNITKGSMYFLQHQSSDPLIELVASNKINKYNVTMYVSGSMQNYNISFESSPPLSEEQIIALLIAGSAQESLNVIAPAIIMQSVKDSLFGSGESKFLGKNYLGKILKPFKNVRIVPSFVDQTGRGGLRGTLEVDLGERARASVQKNFSLSEDTRFELEYLLADDVSIRGVRRENGDIGGEVEMRWKL
jgi:hypothetical protein